jgi:NADH dehydrogenase
MTTVVIGAGPTGVEMAGSIAELARFTLARDFRNIEPSLARTVLVEAGPGVLTAFPEPLKRYARDQLEKLGVELRLSTPVQEISERGVRLQDEEIPAGTIVWAAGVRATPVAGWLGLEGGSSGRVAVDPDLTVSGLDYVYSIGDVALLKDKEGRPLPGLAQVAKQQGQHLGRQLAGTITSGAPLQPFKFHNRGNVAIIGCHAAVFDAGSIRLKGWAAWFAWAVIHVYLLVGVQHRVLVSMQWLWRYATYERGARLIADDPGSKRRQE